MSPAKHLPDLLTHLDILVGASADADPVLVRFTTKDGSTVVGAVRSVSADNVVLVSRRGDIAVRASDIVLIDVGQRRRDSEWRLVGIELGLAGVVLTCVSLVPALYFSPLGLKALALGVTGSLGVSHVSVRNRARDWFVRWTPLEPWRDA